MFSPGRKGLPLLGTWGWNCPLGADPFGPSLRDPSELNRGLRSRKTLQGHPPGELQAHRPLPPLALDSAYLVMKLNFLLRSEGIILILIHLPETFSLPAGSFFLLPSFSQGQRRNH